eukprot:365006-Chlamydomonas_euryale.AAC.6
MTQRRSWLHKARMQQRESMGTSLRPTACCAPAVELQPWHANVHNPMHIRDTKLPVRARFLSPSLQQPAQGHDVTHPAYCKREAEAQGTKGTKV